MIERFGQSLRITAVAALLASGALASSSASGAAAGQVATVFTAEDIQRMGARSIEDLLKRTPGFWASTSLLEDSIGSRGVSADVNNNYLLMIDGHRLNAVSTLGPGNEHILPLLDKAERVEILRTPSSVRWGNGAALGVIHIITKDASKASSELGSRYSGADRQLDVNLQSEGSVGPEGRYLFSGTYVNGRGWAEEGGSPNVFHSVVADQTNAGRWRELNPTYELYGKFALGGVVVSARDLYWDELENATSFSPERNNQIARSSFFDILHETKWGESGLVELRLYSDRHTLENEQKLNLTPELAYVFDERSLGGEAVISGERASHRFTFGAGVELVQTEPATQVLLSISSHVVLTPPGTNTLIAAFTRHTRSYVFADDQVRLGEGTDLLLGARHEEVSLYEGGGNAGRFGLVRSLGGTWTAKLFEMGFLFPDLVQGRNLMSGQNATQPQNSLSHNVQIAKESESARLAVTLSRTRIKDMLVPTATGYANAPPVETRGAEAEFRVRLARPLAFYGNWAYALATADEDPFGNLGGDKKGWLGMPHQTFGAGMDVSFKENLSLDVHVRGWRDAQVDAFDPDLGTNVVQSLDGELALDATLSYRKILGSPLSVSLFGTNLLDNDGRTPNQQVDGGWIREMGKSYGLKASYQF